MSELCTAFEAIGKDLEALRKRYDEVRRASAKGKVEDYALQGPKGRVRLSKLFGKKRDLLVIQNMGRKCPYCTMWADTFNGIAHHVEDRAALVVVSPDAPADQKAFAKKRGWRFAMASSKGSRFKTDLGFESATGEQTPGVSAFRLDDDGTIRNVANDVFGPGDLYCGAWHLFDLLEGGAGDWGPKFAY
jgi:predicted dithiol-disulfide oxidoreductase (DUF899 family)